MSKRRFVISRRASGILTARGGAPIEPPPGRRPDKRPAVFGMKGGGSAAGVVVDAPPDALERGRRNLERQRRGEKSRA